MGRVAIVTGAAGGIGRALCKVFTTAGYETIAVDVAHAEFPAGAACRLELDLERYCDDSRYRDEADARLHAAVGTDGVAALVNNAAVQIVKPLEQLTAADWRRTLGVNLVAPFLLTRSLLAQLEAGGGSVVNISSVHARLTKPGFAAYATSKAALEGLTRSLAVELGRRVRVNAIAPGAVSTPMLVAGFAGRDDELRTLGAFHPVGRLGEPEEVARLALYLVGDAAGFINGATFPLDGGVGQRLHDPG